MENRRLNIILLIVSVILVLLTRYVTTVIKETQDSKVLFNINEIKNITYKDRDTSFYTDGYKFKFIIKNETIYDEEIKLNKETGEIIEGKLYIRSINEKFIVVWYNEIEYKLYK